MFGTIAGSSTGNNLTALGNEALESPHVLIVDGNRFVSTEAANLPSSTGPSASPKSAFALATTTLTTRLVGTLRRGGNRFVSKLIRHCLLILP